jgi:type I restriction enzyme M protein
LKEQAEKELAALEPGANSKQLILVHLLPNHDSQSVRPERSEAKSKAKRLRNDIAILEHRIEMIQRLTDSIGGMITELEAKALILQKHHDLVAEQLGRYLNAEKRGLLNVFENLWEKYAISGSALEIMRGRTNEQLNCFLQNLSYLRRQ